MKSKYSKAASRKNRNENQPIRNTASRSPGGIMNACIIRKKTNRQKPETTAPKKGAQHYRLYPGIPSSGAKICSNKYHLNKHCEMKQNLIEFV